VLAVAYTFTWVAYLVGLPGTSWDDPLTRVVIITICQLAMFAVVLVARWTVLRHTDVTPRPWATLATFLLASIAAREPMGYLMEAQGLAAPGTTTESFPSAIPAIFLVLVVSALAVDVLAEQRRTWNLLNEQRERLTHTRAVVSRVIADRQQDTVDRITADLTLAIDELSADSPREAVETLRWAAQDLVRPLSHELATQTDAFTPSPPAVPPLGLDWRRVMREATSGRPIPALPLTLTALAVAIVFRISRLGIEDALAASVAVAVATYFAAIAGNRILDFTTARLSTGWRSVSLTVTLVVIGLVGAAIELIIASDHGTVGVVVLHVWVIVFLGWALAIGRATTRQLARTETELQRVMYELDWEIARANQTQWQRQRALARALHGPVQAAVNAAALRLDTAARDGNATPVLIESERQSILSALNLLSTATADTAPDVELAFERIRGTWAGICDVDIHVSAEVMANVTSDPACSAAVTDIVTESCANAVRHGRATHITVSMTQPDSPRLLRVDIDNDGTPLDRSSPAGLGTTLIDDVALDWQLDTGPTGTRMSATLPTAIGPTRGHARRDQDRPEG
jgi:signal transduction histidine kinase